MKRFTLIVIYDVDFFTDFKKLGNGIIQETKHRTRWQDSPTSDEVMESEVLVTSVGIRQVGTR